MTGLSITEITNLARQRKEHHLQKIMNIKSQKAIIPQYDAQFKNDACGVVNQRQNQNIQVELVHNYFKNIELLQSKSCLFPLRHIAYLSGSISLFEKKTINPKLQQWLRKHVESTSTVILNDGNILSVKDPTQSQ